MSFVIRSGGDGANLATANCDLYVFGMFSVAVLNLAVRICAVQNLVAWNVPVGWAERERRVITPSSHAQQHIAIDALG